MSEGRIIDEGERWSEELAAQRAKRDGGRWRCPHDLRGRIVAYALVCSADGESHTRTAARLGIKQRTLSRWIARWRHSHPVVRQVAIVPAERRTNRRPAVPASSELRLRTPRGFVVEGLDAELLASLLQVLG
jgi:transposase-like protein